MIKDRDRLSRQDKKQIEYLEQENKRTKGMIKEVQEALTNKETDFKNLEKEKEQLTIELKNLQRRFEIEKQKCEQN